MMMIPYQHDSNLPRCKSAMSQCVHNSIYSLVKYSFIQNLCTGNIAPVHSQPAYSYSNFPRCENVNVRGPRHSSKHCTCSQRARLFIFKFPALRNHPRHSLFTIHLTGSNSSSNFHYPWLPMHHIMNNNIHFPIPSYPCITVLSLY